MNILNIINEEILNINENPDEIKVNGVWIDYRDRDSYPFTMIKGYGDRIFVGNVGTIHRNIIDKYDLPDELNRYGDFIFDGRIWIDKKIISFWQNLDPKDIKDFVIRLGQVMNIDIWDDPDYLIDVRSNTSADGLIPLRKYVGSSDPTDQEKLQHVQSPLLKKPTNVPQGVGSRRYGEKKPLAYQQAMSMDEVINDEINKLNEDPDYIETGLASHEFNKQYRELSTRWRNDDAYPFASIPGYNDKIFLGKAGGTHGSIMENGYDIPEDLDRETFFNDGRIWIKQKVISFWKYPPVSEFKKVILDLEDEFKSKYNMDVNIWNDPDYLLEIKLPNFKYTLIPLRQYVGSENPSPEEFQQHVQSPMLKKKVEVPQGVGSKRYGEKKPLSYRQAMQVDEIINQEINKLNENPDEVKLYVKDAEGQEEYVNVGWTNSQAYPFTCIAETDNIVYLGKAGDTHGSINKNGYDLPYNLTRRNMINAGRIWTSSAIISFWEYPQKSDLKQIILNLEAEFKIKYNMNIKIWDALYYRLEIRYVEDNEWKYTLIPLQQYVKSENPSPEELQQHIQSPLLKKSVDVPQGIGSKRYGEKKPLAYRQAMQVDEIINQELKKLNF
jgi:hypothetical protein